MDIRNNLSILFTILLLHLSFFLNGQPVISSENEQQLENLSEQSADDVDLSEFEEQRSFLLENPIDLNHSTREELVSSGLFNILETEAILDHIKKFDALICLEELQSIDGFELTFIQSILPYLTLKGPLLNSKFKFKSLLEQGKGQLTIRLQRILETQDGYKASGEDDPIYKGNPWKVFTKFRFAAGRYFSLGVTAEKDPGEEFFKGSHKKDGFDFYSIHLFVRPGNFVKALALGDYQVQYGQGLVAWSGLAFGKSSEVIAVKRQGLGIRPYSSANEFSFLRGAAISLERKKTTLDIWGSSRKLDGNLVVVDTLLSSSEISSFGMAGYHRTINEMTDKNAIQQNIFGLHIQNKQRLFSLGLTAQYEKYNKALNQGTDPYEVFDASGNEFYNFSLDYSRLWKNFNLFGESAIDKQGNPAFVNGLLVVLDSKVSLAIIHRYYSNGNSASFANPFREGSKTQNERGTYEGIQINLMRTMKLTTYLDVFCFPWLRYRVDAPTHGREWLSQLTYSPSRTTEIYVRIKQQIKPGDDPLHLTAIDHQENFIKTNLRVNVHFKVNSSFTFHSRVECLKYYHGNSGIENGNLFLQEIICKPMGKRWSISGSYLLFMTDSYDSRVYAYEQDLPGAAGIPGFYYAGSRYYLICRLGVAKGIDAWFRFSRTIYDNRETIGTGYEEIEGTHKSEVKIQLRLSF